MGRRIHFIAVALLFSFGASARAYIPPPLCSYTKPCNEQHIFVFRNVETGFFGELCDGEECRAINSTYKQSGLYRIGEPGKPIWSIDLFSRAENLMVLDDGIHLIDIRSGLTIYAEGQRIVDVRLEDLAYRNLLTEERFEPVKWLKSFYINQEKGTLEVVSIDDCRTVIDYRSGAILSHHRPWSSRLQSYGNWILGTILCTAIIGAGLFLRARSHRRWRSAFETAMNSIR